MRVGSEVQVKVKTTKGYDTRKGKIIYVHPLKRFLTIQMGSGVKFTCSIRNNDFVN